MPLPFHTARTILGLPSDFRIKTIEDYNLARKVWKIATVAARRNGQTLTEKDLNQAIVVLRSKLMNLQRRVCHCGKFKNLRAKECLECSRQRRHYANKLDQVQAPFVVTFSPNKNICACRRAKWPNSKMCHTCRKRREAIKK